MTTNLLKKSVLSFVLMIGAASFVSSQTRPTSLVPIEITEEEPYVQNFNGITGTSGTDIYPSGWGVWNIGAVQQGGLPNPRIIESPTTNSIAKLNIGGSAATTTASVYTFGQRLGFKNGTSSDFAIYAALSTTSVPTGKSVKISFDAMVIRNLYDGTTNDFMLALALQYRIGDTGDFINIDETIKNGTNQQTSGSIPANQQTVSFVLPAECSGKAIVHLRWITKHISGTRPDPSDNMPSFAIDNFIAEVVTTAPVDLKYFKGEVENNKVRLNWVTLSETTNSHFEVLYSKDGKSFDFLERIEGKGTSGHVNNYAIYHNQPVTGTNYYKLIQYDKDGAAQEKGLIAVSFGLASSSKDLILYPNPVYNEVNIKLEDVKGGTFNIQVYDISGRKVYSQQYLLDKGSNTLTLALREKIPAGQYIIKVEGNGSSKTGKLQVR